MAGQGHSDSEHHPHMCRSRRFWRPAARVDGFDRLHRDRYIIRLWLHRKPSCGDGNCDRKGHHCLPLFYALALRQEIQPCNLVVSVACMLFFSITMLDSDQYQGDILITNPMPHEAAAAEGGAQ